MNINKANIANAIHSVAKDHVVAVAEDIYDESREQYQSTLNEGVGLYENNPEFVEVKTDSEGKILYSVLKDGNFYFGAGVPSQIQDLINATEGTIDEKIALIEAELQRLDDIKIDKEEGKSLIPTQYIQEVEDNPEFVKVVLDAEDKILYGIKADGDFVFGYGVPSQIQEKLDELGIYEDNPEYVRVYLDKEGKILWGIKSDGSIYYGAGIPTQIKEYIDKRIQDLSLDEYEDIVAFLSDYLGSDTTLKVMIDSINERIPEIIENPEFLEVTTDSEGKVLGGIQVDGTKVISGGIKVLGNMEVSGVSYKVIENPEYLAAWVDAEDKIIFGFKTDGKTYVGDADFLDDLENIKAFLNNIIDKNIDWDALSSITAIENPEYIDVKVDSEDKILEGITTDGVKKINIPVDNGAAIIETTDNPEFLEAKIDLEGRFIEGVNRNGEKIFGVIPPQIKQYIDENMPTGGSGIQSIEYDDATGDMYATYDDESGVTDVSMEPNGDIIVEYETGV